MIQNKITHLLTDSITIPREVRQRTNLTPESVLELAESIGRSQWIAPILVDSESSVLIAGERRLTAVQLLHNALNGNLEDSLQQVLAPVCKCDVASWAGWTKIPTQLATHLTPIDLMVYEFIENSHRKDLPWQDKSKAINAIHLACHKDSGGKWTGSDTARLVGLDQSTVNKFLKVQDAMTNEELKPMLMEAPTANSAASIIERYTSRREDKPRIMLGRPNVQAPVRKVAHPVTTSVEHEDDENTPAPSPILHADFHEWAADYTGEPFNFIHCDFPYGIGYNTGGNFSSAQDTISAGEYDDSPDVYWDLIKTLGTHSSILLSPSAHIMFWFSQNLRRETEDALLCEFPHAFIQPFMMIWQHDALQTTPDHTRYGQRNYETAMLLTLGDRKIVRPARLAYSHNPTTKIHRSQKPLPVLSHFFSMFVDSSTNMLDPTCGSATSLIAAHKAGAASTLGLECDKDMYERAQKHFTESL